MLDRAKALALHSVDTLLRRRGYEGVDLELARKSVRDWGRARLRTSFARGSAAGLAVVVASAGKARLVPVEVAIASRGELTIEVLVSAISPGTERAQWLRLPNAQPAFPYYPGYSGVGRVLAVGNGVSGFSEGDIVAVPRIPHASVATFPAKWAVPVPEGVDLPQAALVYLAMISGYGVHRAGVEEGASVCVLGAGPIGSLAARLARLAGAGRMTIAARTPRHKDTAVRVGAEFRLTENGLADVAADVVMDASGDPEGVSTAILAARDGGTIVLLGSPRGISAAVPIARMQQRRLRLIGAHISALSAEVRRNGGDRFGELGAQFFAALRKGELRADDLVGESIDPREVNLMYRRLGDGVIGSAHLDWRRIGIERVERRSLISKPVLPTRSAVVRAQRLTPPATAERPLRFAVVGCGDIGLSNARAIARARNAELVLLHDPVLDLASAAAARYGGEAVPSLEQALDSRRVDAVLVSVPHDLHQPVIEQAATAGLAVIVEKPLGVDLASALSAVNAAERAGVILSVCFPYRYEAAPAAAQALVEAGALGPLRGATLSFHADKPQSYWHGGFSGRATSDWRSSRARAGGGVMIMNMTHFVDLLTHLAGSDVETVHAFADFGDGREVEDRIAVTVRMQGGAIATLAGSASTRGVPETRFEIWGEHGTLDLGPTPRIYTERSIPGVVTGCWNMLPVDDVDVRVAYVERFAGAVLEGREPDITARDALATQAFVDAVYRSSDSGAPESVSRVQKPT